MAYAFGGIHPFTWLGAHVTWASAPTRRIWSPPIMQQQSNAHDKGRVAVVYPASW